MWGKLHKNYYIVYIGKRYYIEERVLDQGNQGLTSAGQNQVDPPESVSHEIQDNVSVRTEIFVGAESFILL